MQSSHTRPWLFPAKHRRQDERISRAVVAHAPLAVPCEASGAAAILSRSQSRACGSAST